MSDALDGLPTRYWHSSEDWMGPLERIVAFFALRESGCSEREAQQLIRLGPRNQGTRRALGRCDSAAYERARAFAALYRMPQ